MSIKFKKDLYTKTILFKACYSFTDKAYVHLDSDCENYIVSIYPKDESDSEKFEKMFSNQMIEESARETILEQTKNIRQILFARALASSVIYDKSNAEINTDVSDKSAMKDWFSNE